MDYDDIPQIENPISVFPKPQRMFPEDQRVPGGQYLNARTKEDMTGHKAAAASIGVHPGGKPYFNASGESVDETGSSGRGNATAKTNLFKQKAGWKWVNAPEGHEETNTIVSVEHRGHHHYALNAHFPKGVDLARYENSPSEPRLRPTTKGNVAKGNQVGSISVRGKEHPVYDHLIVKGGGGEVDGDEGITAYHGSPHDFEQFDTSKIGTGEGAQAYGHGLYFAQAEPVAKEYRDQLTQGPTHVIFPKGDKDEWGNPIRFHPEELTGHESAAAKAVLNREGNKGQLEWLKKSPIERDEAAKAMRLIRSGGIEKTPAGHMYEVHINAHPHHMLDWDKPLSEQSEHIYSKLEQLAANDEKKYGYGGGLHYYFTDPDSYSGGSIHQYLAEQHGPEAAAKFLHNAGIKGIKYLDAGSRNDKAEPTHNYVVFDHNDVHIKRKYAHGGEVDEGHRVHFPSLSAVYD